MKRVRVRRALGGAAICLAGGATLALAGAAAPAKAPLLSVPADAATVSSAQPAGSLLDRFEIASGNIMTIAGAPAMPASQPPRNLALYGLSGIGVNPHDGTVYVTDAVRHMIFRLDAKGTTIEPFAGTRSAGFNGDGRPGLETQINVPADLVVDPRTGDVYFADSHNYRIRAVSRDGSKVWTVAGRGIRGVLPAKIPVEWPLIGPKGRRDTVVYSGDGGPALQAELNQPTGVALDAAGNVYVADTSNHRVRAVNRQSKKVTIAGVEIPPGAIATIAGSGERGFAGDGGPATAAKMDSPRKVRVTADGDVLFIDMLNQRIRKIDHQTGRIDTVAKGTTFPGQLPGGAEVVFFAIDGLDIGPKGEVIYSDLQANSVFQLDLAKGTAKVIVGAGLPGRSANGEEATAARLHGAGAVALAPGGEIYIVDVWNTLLWQFKDGHINIFAGGGPTGDGGPSQEAEFGPLAPIDVDPRGNLYISDMYAHTVRRIRADSGLIERFAGTGAVGYSGDGGPARDAKLLTIINLSVIDDDIYLADSQIPNVRRVVHRPAGEMIETFAGVPFQWQYKSGDGGPAKLAQFGLPQSVVRHPKTGDYYISDSWLNNIRRIDSGGVIHAFAGVSGQQNYGGDGGPASQAKFGWPVAMVFDDDGNLYIVDHFNSRIRKIDNQGIITTFAGTGERGPDGEGVPADQAQLNYPLDIARGKDNAIYIADMGNNCVRRIDLRPPHLITTAAGICGERGFSGDGGPARIAHLNVPRGIAIGPDNALYIADSFNGRIRAVRLP
jgi:DNA-binding beta-propeller fold protein YncE